MTYDYTKVNKAIDILRNKMTRAEFDKYAKEFKRGERSISDIEDYFVNSTMDEQELDDFIKKYDK